MGEPIDLAAYNASMFAAVLSSPEREARRRGWLPGSYCFLCKEPHDTYDAVAFGECLREDNIGDVDPDFDARRDSLPAEASQDLGGCYASSKAPDAPLGQFLGLPEGAP